MNTIACESCDEWYYYTCVGLSKSEVNKLDPTLPFICWPCNENERYNTNNLYQKSTSQNNNNSQSFMIKQQSATLFQTLADSPILETQSQIIIHSGTTPEISPGKTASSVTTSAQNNFPAKLYRDLEITQVNLHRAQFTQETNGDSSNGNEIKALETQTMQNLSIQTAMTTQLPLQIQQQTIAKLQNSANLPTYMAPPSYTQPQHYNYTTPPYYHQNIKPSQMPLSEPTMSHPGHMISPNMCMNHPPPLHPN
ncbi:unnamed protein product [Mytilus coruscus]|uniref:PHD-type domain-containing protein n=1 Tax=Mytilus coruscus TaxID=42192 RepID=A0A6J8CHU1_MYTCO|nr:unnamed protein product [Mytilus coruscus]